MACSPQKLMQAMTWQPWVGWGFWTTVAHIRLSIASGPHHRRIWQRTWSQLQLTSRQSVMRTARAAVQRSSASCGCTTLVLSSPTPGPKSGDAVQLFCTVLSAAPHMQPVPVLQRRGAADAAVPQWVGGAAGLGGRVGQRRALQQRQRGPAGVHCAPRCTQNRTVRLCAWNLVPK